MNRTALHDFHVEAGAKMVDFAGWEMPVQYTGIIDEHLATRNSCTMFDVSHMGRLYLLGPQAEELLERLCTRDIGSMQPGQCRYSHMCREDGGILDDVIVSRFEDKWLVVCNASNREKIVAWMQRQAGGMDLTLDDQTMQTVMLAVQGPEVHDITDDLLPVAVADVKRYRFKSGRYMGVEYICSRTGYTGEDGFELIVPRAAGKMMAGSVFEDGGAAHGRITPAGLGARDTLRLEAGMPLYGHELSEDLDSISAGQGWCVNLEKDFIGADPMRRVNEEGPHKRLVGLEIEGRRIARQGAELQVEGQVIGIVTSGTLSPTLQKVIAMAFVQSEYAETGQELDADIRGKVSKAHVVPLPFYKKSKQ